MTKYPVGDGEVEMLFELAGYNEEENTSTVNYSMRVTKPITIAVFTLASETEADDAEED